MSEQTIPLSDVQRALVEKNLDLAHHLALAIWRRNPHIQDKDEIVAVAYEGLVTAASRFDPSRADVVNGVPDLTGAFSGYARRRIQGSILDWQRKRDHVPKRQRSTYKELQAFGHGQGRSPLELSDLTGMPIDRIKMIIRAVESPVLSMTRDDTHDLEESGALRATQWDMPTASDIVESDAMEDAIISCVVSAWDALPDLQRLVIAMRYYAGLDLITVAQETGVRLSSVRAAHAEGLLFLHAAMVREAS